MKDRQPQRVLEKFCTIAEVKLCVMLCEKVITAKMLAGEFGDRWVDLAEPAAPGKKQQHDYRIPASGVNAWLDSKRGQRTPEEFGISARSEGELRRKIQNQQLAASK